MWLLEDLGIEYNLVLHERTSSTDPKRPFLSPPALLAVGPYGQAPILITGPADGNRYITESSAIATYLIRKFDIEDKFGLKDGDWIRDEVLTSLTAVLGRSTSEILMVEFGYIKGNKINPLDGMLLRKTLRHVERELEEGPSGGFFMGKSPGRADILLEFPLSMIQHRSYVNLATEFPALDKWLKLVYERPAFKTSLDKGNGYDLNTFPKFGREVKL